jgi:hypothetical protein
MKRGVFVLATMATIASMGGCELKCRSEPEGSAEKIGEAIDDAVREVTKPNDGEVEVKIKAKEKKP